MIYFYVDAFFLNARGEQGRVQAEEEEVELEGFRSKRKVLGLCDSTVST